MDNSEKQFGRKRVRKNKPNLATESKEISNPENNEKTESENPLDLANAIEKPRTDDKPKIDKPRERKYTKTHNSDKNSRYRKSDSRNNDNRSRKPYQNKNESSKSRYSKPTSSHRSYPKSNIRVSVIIPAYNEQENIKLLVEQFAEVLKSVGKEWEVILINDGSTDRTESIARGYSKSHPWLKVLSHPVNRGLTAALNTGFKAARGTIFTFYPADLQYHAQDIPRMVAKIDKGADVVTGWKQGKYNKKFVSFIYNKLCRMLFGLKIHDMNSVKVFKKEVVKDLTLRRDWHRYLVVLAAQDGFSIDEVKVKLYPRKYGTSKFGTGRILGGLLDLFSVKFQISFLRKPLRFFGTWGFIFGGLGFLSGLIAVYLRFFTEQGSRTLLFPTILFLLAGLLLFAIGFLAEVIVGLREEIESLKSK
jgi:glycosyltransferase involved in cell wall biosynthesis